MAATTATGSPTKRTRAVGSAGQAVAAKPGASRRGASGATTPSRSRPVSTSSTPATARAAVLSTERSVGVGVRAPHEGGV